jgi:hypothetical protein
MWRMSFGMARAIALTFVMALCCNAQTWNIWPSVAPGSENWAQKERVEKDTPIGTVVFNVVTPSLESHSLSSCEPKDYQLNVASHPGFSCLLRRSLDCAGRHRR